MLPIFEVTAESINDTIARYKTMVNQNPDSFEAQCGLADTYVKKYLKTSEKKLLFFAKKAAGKAEEIAPNSPLPYLSMARLFIALDKRDKALNRVQKAFTLDPGNAEAQQLLQKLGGKKTEKKNILDTKHREGSNATGQIQMPVYQDLDKWEILNGNWYVKNGKIYGSGGTIILNDVYRDYILEFTIEHISGPRVGVGIGMRGNVIQGGKKRYRNDSSDIQGYAFNFTFNKTYNLFNGIGGNWYLINPEWKDWQYSDQLDKGINKIRYEASGSKLNIFVNGVALTGFSGDTHAEGSPFLWVQDPAQIIRFSHIKLTQK